eukprot:CAMPEP_0118725992 /NCGR_PEP_ID=MMETSP0800-20121206/33447_1 /TAXON_ID=210618 ORGANISM="Striatella unipunctata, Strain CCMP2910" /NCGR_SAMPLE_ID=MMETSP0800 /ASSEMBLY_ACC=CAM_ASM_000638 /LENGTH=182 /DNA_ID=CAMNT_0006634751 /DNA_START=21 /DNA_END=570 /DNA_ORIENTATION=-
MNIMYDQGFDPDSADYDNRTALMVASMKGNVDTVAKLLEFHVNPNLIDVHGSTALYEATQHGHAAVMELLLQHGAELAWTKAAPHRMCQAVFDGDTQLLRRLLKAKIDVNASDYDKRTAIHIAAAEGNLAAVKILVQHGANINVKDRWNNGIMDEAKSVQSGQLVEYLNTLTFSTSQASESS